jgi:signal transduction histidine kinase
VWAGIEGPNAAPVLVADVLLAAATVAFLALYPRYGVFIDSAEMRDEYAQKEREARALAQVNAELRRLDELKSEFLAMVSHELRTPLTAIIGYSRLMMRQVHGRLTPKQLEHQEAIFRGAQRLSDLINDLLDVSRLEAGRIELAPRPTDVPLIVEQAATVVAVAAQARQIRITSDFPPDMTAAQADPTRLQQILVNLIGNAVKFSTPGGSVRVTGGRHRDQIWVAVEDDGVGIAKEELARIWDPFYQAEAPMRRRHGGSGLGLAIVRRLVELHGGVVRAESGGENRGSRFSFTLPLAAEPATQDTKAGEGLAPLEPILNGREVLVVEDEKQNQELLRAVVEDLLGGRARVCDNGEHCLRLAHERKPAGHGVGADHRRLRPLAAAGPRVGASRRLRRLRREALHARRDRPPHGRHAGNPGSGSPMKDALSRRATAPPGRVRAWGAGGHVGAPRKNDD